MMEFGKRLSWRLTGGIAAVAMGALAAAQSQRQDLPQDSEVPQIHDHATAPSMIQPIVADNGNSSAVQPANFIAAMPPGNRVDHSASDSQSNLDDTLPQTFIARVAHNEPMNGAADEQMDRPEAAVDSAAHGAPMSLPQAAFNPAGMMGLPNEMAEPSISSGPSTDLAPGPNSDADTNNGPAMALSFMGLPQAQDDHLDGEVPTESPSFNQPSPEPEMTDASPMSDVQFDQGPMMMDATASMTAPTSIDAPTSMDAAASMNDGPAMANDAPMYGLAPTPISGPMYADESIHDAEQVSDPMEHSPGLHPAPAMQGFTSPPSGGAGESIGNNALRAPAAMENQLRSASLADSQNPHDAYAPALPELPSPTMYQDNAGTSRMQGNESGDRQTPAQYAGHQQQADPMMALPGQNLAGNAPGQDAYLASGNEHVAINLPGDRRLEGAQSPSVVIHKRAPAEVKVGQPATFVIQVRNVGSAEALAVLVHDRVPAGMQLVDATPAPTMQGDLLVWQLGSMPAGDERSITMQLVAQEEGELGSVARVTFEAAASVRTRSTRPELKITQRAPQKVLIGQQLEIELEVANIGTGVATGVILQADVPPGLDHPNGRQLDNAIGDLRPGEVRREVLRMRAVEAGTVDNIVNLTSADAKPVSHTVSVEVVAPGLNVAISGPSRRFLERQASYTVKIDNPGSAAARNVEVVARLDRGFTFVSTENNGQYDPNRHAVRWSVVELPAGEVASVPLTLLPIEAGDQVIHMEATADLDTRSESEHIVAVESKPELTFSIADTADPIELGSETSYEIKVRNAGSRNDTNVQVRLLLPPGIEMLESDADAGTDGRGGVVFAPHANLPAGGDLTYRVRVRGVQPDTHVIKAIVTSDQARVPVTKEESTMVYADR